jgi:hypothetical protein
MTANGEQLLAVDFAGFAGTENEEQSGFEFGAIYKFSRTPSGWSTEALEPPASRFPRREFVAASADLSRSLWAALVGNEGEERPLPQENDFIYIMRELTAGGAGFATVGPVVAPGHGAGAQGGFGFVSGSGDLGRMVVDVRSEHKQLWPGDKTREGANSLYEYSGTSNPEPALVGVTNAGPLGGKPHLNEDAELVSECGTILGSRLAGTVYNALSANGTVAYFTAQHVEGCSGHQPPVNELYARLNGSQTVDISEPAMTPQREKECSGICREDQMEEKGHKRSGARFEGASEDGSRVFFATDQPLLNSDEDSGPDLYEAVVEGGVVKHVVQVSHPPIKGLSANVVSVVRSSGDGAQVYYVAKGVLTAKPNGKGEAAEEGGYNLYAYDTHGEYTSFVANLLTRGEREELEGSEELKAKAIKMEEQKAKIEAKRSEIKATQAESESRKAECKKDRENGNIKLAEECEAKVKEEEATLIGDETELSADEVALKETEQALARQIAEQIRDKTGVSVRDERRPFETTPDGRLLAFVSARHLTGSEDTSTVGQVFEYDAQTEALLRVSVGQRSAAFPGGYGDNGNTTNKEEAPKIVKAPEYEAQMLPTNAASNLSLSENGAVVFSSMDRLTPLAVQGRENIYQYRAGNVYLVSPGSEAVPIEAPDDSRLLGTDQTGRDVFFLSNESLVPQDNNTQSDWYDAREGGGFPGPPSPTGCTGDACQGALSATPFLPSEGGSAATAGGGNLAAPVSKAVVKPRVLTRAQKLIKALKACKRKPKKQRAACEKQARKQYAPAKKKGKGKR